MKRQERISLINNFLQKLLNKVSSGSALSYLILTDKQTKKYIQCSLSAGEKKVIIDIPEGQLSPEEVNKVSSFLTSLLGEEVISFQAEVEIEKLPDIIDKIFIECLGSAEDYDLEIVLPE